MIRWIYASAFLALLLMLLGYWQHDDGNRMISNAVYRRQNAATSGSDGVPDYVMVSPDYVALAPSAKNGLSANSINDMMCLANRHRYDKGLPALALDAELVQYAQQRAELLASTKAKIANNQVVGDGGTPIIFNETFWSGVKENLLQSTGDATFAYWDMQGNGPTEDNILSQSYTYFGVGRSGNYYVQTFGIPKDQGADRQLFPWCPSNETFSNWVFPKGTPSPPVGQRDIANKPFPFELYQKTSKSYYNAMRPDYDSGLVAQPSYYFSPREGSVPYLKDLSIIDSVAASNSKTPFAAIANAGEQGLTKEELNMVVCMINSRRYSSCLPPVALHSQLIAAAQAHSYDMNRARNMSHYDSAGSMGMRIKRRGFAFSQVGENVAYGVHDAYTMFAMFSESQTHLDNMLNPGFNFVGSGRSGQYWTVVFGSYLDKSQTPDLNTIPLCPGNKTDIAIAFPSGLPSKPKLQTTACGGTLATPVVPPPYIQTHSGGNGDGDTPTPSPTSAPPPEPSVQPKPSSDGGVDAGSSTTKPTKWITILTTICDSDSTAPTPATSEGPSDPAAVTQTVAQTVYVDGDALMTSWQSMCAASHDYVAVPVTSGKAAIDTGYVPSPLGNSSFDIVIEPPQKLYPIPVYSPPVY